MTSSNLAESLLEALSHEPGKSHELLFYATFAHRTFLLMQRTGPGAEGFDRLQQTFAEVVTKVRALIGDATQHGFQGAAQLTEISQAGMANLLDLMRDLARIKQAE